MQRVLVHRQQREPGIVGFTDRSPGLVPVHVTDAEVFVVAADIVSPAAMSFLIQGDRLPLQIEQRDRNIIVSDRNDVHYVAEAKLAGSRHTASMLCPSGSCTYAA